MLGLTGGVCQESFLRVVVQGEQKHVCLRFQLGLGYPTALVFRVADEVASSFKTHLHPVFGTQCQNSDCHPIDCVVRFKNSLIQLLDRQWSPHSKPLNEEAFHDPPDLFNWRQVGGVRRPATKTLNIVVAKPPHRCFRCVTGRAILLEDCPFSRLSQESDDALRFQHVNVRLRVESLRAFDQMSFPWSHDASPHHDRSRIFRSVNENSTTPLYPPHHRRVRRCRKTQFIRKQDKRPVSVRVVPTKGQAGRNLSFCQERTMAQRLLFEVEVVSYSVDGVPADAKDG